MGIRNQNVAQYRVGGTQTHLRTGQNVEEIELFDHTGTKITLGAVAAHVAPVAVVNATDLPTAEALANQNKATINAVIAALIAAGLMSAT